MARKIINSGEGYRKITDEERLIAEQKIEDAINSPNFPTNTGLFLTQDRESLPIFGPVGEIERVFSRRDDAAGPAGARIVLTKDNFGHRATGLGGAGGTQCEAIDIVAGQLSCEKNLFRGDTKSRASFPSDGARIYLTERGDIQHYFALGEPSKAVSVSSDLKSGIGIKADHTLVIGRERVRILAGLSNVDGGERLVNQNENPTPKIEIAAINDDGAQPAVLGDNLVKYLKDMNATIDKLNSKVQILEQKLLQYKVALALHIHQGAGLGAIVTFPDPQLVTETAQSIPEFLNVTTENLIDSYNQSISNLEAMGTEDQSLPGSADKKLLSKTVYIGQ